MVKYIKQKQQQKQQLQSLLPPELATLDTPLGGLLIIKGGLPLLRVLEYGISPIPVTTEDIWKFMRENPDLEEDATQLLATAVGTPEVMLFGSFIFYEKDIFSKKIMVFP